MVAHGDDETGAARLARAAGLGALVLLFLWLAVAASLDGVLATRAPAVVLRWAPWSSAAKVAMGNALVSNGQGATPAQVAQATRYAQQALNRAPSSAAAARVLGLATLMGGHEGQGRAAMTYAEQMSRRDLATELYWIESEVARGNIHAALHHYDVAMRTTVKSRELLGNVVITAASEAPVARELALLLASRPNWWPEFYQRLMGQGENADSLLLIARAMRFDARDPNQTQFIAMALKRMIQLGAYDRADALYRQAARTGGQPIRDGGFDGPNRLQPFDWDLSDEPTHMAIVETRPGWRGGNVLTVTGTENDIVARQLLLLPPGRYQLRALTANVRQETETRPVLAVTCVSGAGLTALPFAAAGATPAPVRGGFTVPARDCPAQWLFIRNTPSFDPVENDPWIDSIAIGRVAAR